LLLLGLAGVAVLVSVSLMESSLPVSITVAVTGVYDYRWFVVLKKWAYEP
jgi:hypothetical protein